MRSELRAGIVAALFVLMLPGRLLTAAANAPEDQFAFGQNNRLGRGVNIGGNNPIRKNGLPPRLTEKHFKLIKDAGFNNVRIVITPFQYSLKDANFTIDPVFFTNLDWTLRQALTNKLMAIVDFHEHSAMEKDPIGLKPKFLAMWKQIAEHCRNYPKEVLFEIANEPNMKPDIWNDLHSAAYQILRGSNPDRTLLIGPIYGNQIKYLQDLKLPEDDRNIIVPIHYYSPIQFTHQGASWSVKNKNLSGIEWKSTESEEKAVTDDFDMAQARSQKHHRPLTLGEFGAYEKADMPSRVRWTTYIARQAEARNWSWSYWQFDSDFIVYNVNKDQWVTPIFNALIPVAR